MRGPELLKYCHFKYACDFKNRLCGAKGWFNVCGAQKGVKEEEKEIIQEEKARKHKNKKADKRKVRTGGFVDEIDEEDVTGYSENKKKVAIQQTAQTAASEAHAELKKEIAAATSEEADMLSRLEMAERTVEENRKPHPAGKVEEVPEEEEERIKKTDAILLGAVGDPAVDLLHVELDQVRMGAGVVAAHFLDEAAVAGITGISDDNTIERSLLGAHSAQTNFNHGYYLQK